MVQFNVRFDGKVSCRAYGIINADSLDKAEAIAAKIAKDCAFAPMGANAVALSRQGIHIYTEPGDYEIDTHVVHVDDTSRLMPMTRVEELEAELAQIEETIEAATAEISAQHQPRVDKINRELDWRRGKG